MGSGHLAGDAVVEAFQDRGDQRVVSPGAGQVEVADVGEDLLEDGAQPAPQR